MEVPQCAIAFSLLNFLNEMTVWPQRKWASCKHIHRICCNKPPRMWTPLQQSLMAIPGGCFDSKMFEKIIVKILFIWKAVTTSCSLHTATFLGNKPDWNKPKFYSFVSKLWCRELNRKLSVQAQILLNKAQTTSNLTLYSLWNWSLNISPGLLPDCNHIDCQSHQRPLGSGLWKECLLAMFVLSSNTFSSDTLKQNSVLYQLEVLQ